MSNDKKVAELSKKLATKLDYSTGIPKKKTNKPNVAHLKKLSRGFRESLEDYTVEVTIHTVSGKITERH